MRDQPKPVSTVQPSDAATQKKLPFRPGRFGRSGRAPKPGRAAQSGARPWRAKNPFQRGAFTDPKSKTLTKDDWCYPSATGCSTWNLNPLFGCQHSGYPADLTARPNCGSERALSGSFIGMLDECGHCDWVLSTASVDIRMGILVRRSVVCAGQNRSGSGGQRSQAGARVQPERRPHGRTETQAQVRSPIRPQALTALMQYSGLSAFCVRNHAPAQLQEGNTCPSG